jgi:RNA polymerase sigma-70 factor, ECF subfamily
MVSRYLLEEKRLMPESPDIDENIIRLVVSHQAALHAFVMALLPGDSEADDVVQEVNTELWKKRAEFEMGSNFKAWMFSVARFKVMALWRDQKRRKVFSIPEETLNLFIEEAEEVCYAAEDPRHAALRQCIQQLAPGDRGLILRCYFDGYSLKRVAEEVGRKAENLKGSLHRIRLMLRTCVRRKTELRKAMS